MYIMFLKFLCSYDLLRRLRPEAPESGLFEQKGTSAMVAELTNKNVEFRCSIKGRPYRPGDSDRKKRIS